MFYKLVFTDNDGNSKELTQQKFEEFKQQYPDIAGIMLNPENGMSQELLSRTKEKDNWRKLAKKIINNLWKIKGCYLF